MRPPWWYITLVRDHPDESTLIKYHTDDRPPWWDYPDDRSLWWNITLMGDHPDKPTLIKYYPDDRPPWRDYSDDRLLWWNITLMRDHPEKTPHPDENKPWCEEKSPQWETTLMRDHPDERPHWWETTLMREKTTLVREETTLMTEHPDERPHWHEITLMKDHSDNRRHTAPVQPSTDGSYTDRSSWETWWALGQARGPASPARSAAAQADQTEWPSPGCACSLTAASRSPSDPANKQTCLKPSIKATISIEKLRLSWFTVKTGITNLVFLCQSGRFSKLEMCNENK